MTSSLPTGVSSWTEEACRRAVRDLEAEGRGVSHVYGYAPWPDHVNRRCVDFMLSPVSRVRWAAAYFERHAVALGVRLMIADGRIWRAYPKPGLRARRWHRYWGRNKHRDHVHVEFDR